jgi:hypothetical protein
MSDPIRASADESMNASVAHAGEPQGEQDAGERALDAAAGPSPEELDEREAAFTRPRKPMARPPGPCEAWPEDKLHDRAIHSARVDAPK